MNSQEINFIPIELYFYDVLKNIFEYFAYDIYSFVFQLNERNYNEIKKH